MSDHDPHRVAAGLPDDRMDPGERRGPSSTSQDLPDLNDSLDLVQRFRRGSHEALNTLFEQYEGRLLRIIRAHMSPWLLRRLEPEDVLQETLIAGLEKAPEREFDSHAGILRWLSAIARNRILDKVTYHRAQRRDPAREVEPPSRSGEQSNPTVADPDGTSPSMELRRRELEQLVDRHVQALEPEIYREAILQREFYEATWEEVADAIGRETAGAAREVHRRARIKLMSRIGPELGDDLGI